MNKKIIKIAPDSLGKSFESLEMNGRNLVELRQAYWRVERAGKDISNNVRPVGGPYLLLIRSDKEGYVEAEEFKDLLFQKVIGLTAQAYCLGDPQLLFKKEHRPVKFRPRNMEEIKMFAYPVQYYEFIGERDAGEKDR